MGIRQDIQHYVLPNGLRVVWVKRPGSPIAHCALTIGAGSRDEGPEETGLAHFIEHCLFKGTEKRKTFHILNRLDSVGGEVNAYTSKEDTTIHASFLKEHTSRAMELIADIVFRSTFPSKEILKEKDVVLDEIQASLEQPGERIFEEFDELLFGSHPLGHPILGEAAHVKSLGKKQIDAFRARRYHPEMMVFAFYGDMRPKMFERFIHRYLVDFQASGPTMGRKRPKVGKGRHRQRAESQQAHCIIGCGAYDVHASDKLAFILLNNILGGPTMNNLLGLNIRERHGISYNLESHYQAFSDSGLFQIYVSTEKKQMERAIRLIHKELEKLRTKPLGIRQLHAGKNQLKGQIALGTEGGLNTVLGIAKSVLVHDRIEDLEDIMSAIDQITEQDLLHVANEVWQPDRLNTLVYA